MIDPELKPGDQIIYKKGVVDEKGFVTSVPKQGVYCRFFSFYNPAALRTKGNSELCQIEDLTKEDHTSKKLIETIIKDFK